MTEEAIFYNALNIFVKSDYRQLDKAKKNYGSWKTAFENLAGTDLPSPLAEKQKLEKENIRLILSEENGFPSLLREIPWPPFGLYVRGEFPQEKEICFAVVGTRKASPSGKELAEIFGSRLSRAGLTIVSGLAFGIDASAHESALANNGRTIAVLGNGLDYFYPRSNENLAQKILASGSAIISEYPLGTLPLPHRFLERNRIISGLSRGVLIIEAPERSGALATARFAVEQNRGVFVVPGTVNNPNFKGSNKLIRSGAELVSSPEEILESLNLIENNNKKETLPFLENEEEKLILDIIQNNAETLGVDKISEISNLTPQVVNQTLSFLLIKNIVKEENNGYIINNF